MIRFIFRKSIVDIVFLSFSFECVRRIKKNQDTRIWDDLSKDGIKRERKKKMLNWVMVKKQSELEETQKRTKVKRNKLHPVIVRSDYEREEEERRKRIQVERNNNKKRRGIIFHMRNAIQQHKPSSNSSRTRNNQQQQMKTKKRKQPALVISNRIKNSEDFASEEELKNHSPFQDPLSSPKIVKSPRTTPQKNEGRKEKEEEKKNENSEAGNGALRETPIRRSSKSHSRNQMKLHKSPPKIEKLSREVSSSFASSPLRKYMRDQMNKR